MGRRDDRNRIISSVAWLPDDDSDPLRKSRRCGADAARVSACHPLEMGRRFAREWENALRPISRKAIRVEALRSGRRTQRAERPLPVSHSGAETMVLERPTDESFPIAPPSHSIGGALYSASADGTDAHRPLLRERTQSWGIIRSDDATFRFQPDELFHILTRELEPHTCS